MGLDDLIAELTSGDDERAEAAVRQLASRGSEIPPALCELLSSPGAENRWWAVRALAEIPHPAVPPLLLRALHDSESSVRQCAALALRKHPSPEAIPALRVALEDEDPLLARLAGDALIALGTEAVPALIEVVQNGPQVSRLEAVRALAKIGDPRAIPALYAALDDDSAITNYWAEEGLERMGVGWTYFRLA